MAFSKSDLLKIAILRWDQKTGGVIEFLYPKFTIQDNHVMNIYNMHRMRSKTPGFGNLSIKLDNNESFSCITFYSGFGEGGFGGNYGDHVIGISEKVVVLFLDKSLNAKEYEETLSILSSFLLIDQENLNDRLQKIGKIINDSKTVNDPANLNKMLYESLPSKLKLSSEQLLHVKEIEVMISKAYINDLKELIKDLRVNPVSSAFSNQKDHMVEYDKRIKTLTEQIQKLTVQKEISATIDTQKDEIIEDLKKDYVVIFGTLTDQIQALDNELKEIQISTQSFVNDLNKALADKIAENEVLVQRLKNMEVLVKHLESNPPNGQDCSVEDEWNTWSSNIFFC